MKTGSEKIAILKTFALNPHKSCAYLCFPLHSRNNCNLYHNLTILDSQSSDEVPIVQTHDSERVQCRLTVNCI